MRRYITFLVVLVIAAGGIGAFIRHNSNVPKPQSQKLQAVTSFYPLYGLSGAIALALFGVLRLTSKPAAEES